MSFQKTIGKEILRWVRRKLPKTQPVTPVQQEQEVVTEPEVSTIPPVVVQQGDQLSRFPVRWFKADGSQAKVTKKLSSFTWEQNDLLRISYEDLTSWKSTEPRIYVESGCSGMVCLFVLRNQTWLGGKFEHLGNGQTVKMRRNIREGYMEENGEVIIPQTGEEVCLCLLSYGLDERTNALRAIWE